MANTSSLFGGDNYSQLLQNGLVFADGQDGNSGRRSKNFIRNRSGYRNTNGWAVSGACTVTRTTTGSDIVDGVASLKFAAGAVNDYVKNAFTINNIQKGLPLNISFDFITQSGVGGDWDIQIFDVTASAAISVAMPAQGGNSGNMPGGNGTFNAFFIASTNTSYELRIVRKGSGGTFTAANFDVFAGPVRLGTPGSIWQSYTPTLTGFGTIANPDFFWMRYNDSLFLQGRWDNGTVPATTQASISFPAGLTAFDPSTNSHVCGRWVRNISTASAVKMGTMLYANGSTTTFGLDDYTTAKAPLSAVNGDDISSTGNTMAIFAGPIPISQWQSSNVTMADRVLEEYASNSSTTSIDDSVSFVNGVAGSLVPTITASASGVNTLKRVRFQTPIQATDSILIKVQEAGVGPYRIVGQVTGYGSGSYQGGSTYGISSVRVAGSTTDLDVSFGNAGRLSTSATYATSGANYPQNAADRWVAVKVSSGAQIGGAISTANIVGRVDGNAPAAGYIGESLTNKVAAFTGSTGRVQIANLTLTPGVWLMSAVFTNSVINVAVGGTYIDCCISTTAGNSTAGCVDGYDSVHGGFNAATGFGGVCIPSKVVVVPPGASVPYYLNGRTDHTTASDMVSSLSAVRIA